MDGAHTHGHGSSGGGGGTPVLVVLALIVAAAVARPVIHAAVEVLDALAVVAAVLAGLGVAGLAAAAAVRVCRWRLETPRAAHPVTPAPLKASALLSEPRPAIERPGELHLHLHGVTAEDLAALIARQEPPRDAG